MKTYFWYDDAWKETKNSHVQSDYWYDEKAEKFVDVTDLGRWEYLFIEYHGLLAIVEVNVYITPKLLEANPGVKPYSTHLMTVDSVRALHEAFGKFIEKQDA